MTKKATRRFIALLVVGMATFGQANAATMRLSLNDALKMARERNTMLKAQRAKIDQADARIVQSKQAYLPKVTLSENIVYTNDPLNVFGIKLMQTRVTAGDFFNPDFTLNQGLNDADPTTDFNTSLQVMQPIYNRDAFIGGSVAKSAKKAQGFMVDRAEETIELNVKKAFYGLLLAKKNLADLEQSIRVMKGYSAEAIRGYNAGVMNKSDKLSTQVRLAEMQDQKLQILDGIKNAEDSLRMMLALGKDDAIVPVGSLSVDAKIPASVKTASTDGRSDLKALKAFEEVTDYQHDMERAKTLPRVNGFARTDLHTDLESDGTSWMVGLNVQWQIFDGMATRGKIQEAKAQALEARYNYEAAKEKGDLDLDMARRALVTSRERIAVASQSLEAAKVSFDFIGNQYKSGMAMTFELLMREGAYTWAKMRLNQARYDYCIAKSEYDYYTGGK